MTLKTNLVLDAAIFIAFLAIFEPVLTGIPLHEWLSLAFTLTIVAHILLHWQWVAQITVRFFRKLLATARLNYLVDAALFIAFIAMMLSGMLISRAVLPAIGLQAVRDPFWRALHVVSANAGLLMVALHFALHWDWTVNTIKRLIIKPLKSRLVPQPAAIQQPIGAQDRK